MFPFFTFIFPSFPDVFLFRHPCFPFMMHRLPPSGKSRADDSNITTHREKKTIEKKISKKNKEGRV